jgi:hypothetical protein
MFAIPQADSAILWGDPLIPLVTICFSNCSLFDSGFICGGRARQTEKVPE